MGLELELPELAVIRPIRAVVITADDGTTPSRPGSDGEDAADTGCVTPTAAAVSPTPRQSGVDVDAGCVTPTAAASLPQQGAVEDDNTGCVTPTARSPAPGRGVAVVDNDASYVTPTSAASVLPPSTECPPAPRKPARSPVPNKRKLCGSGGGPAPRRCFFPVPRDLTKVFVARGPADGSPPQAAKKIRVHPVG